MTTYYVDSVRGSNTSPYDTWAKAATSFWSVGSPAATLAGSDIVYVASDHVDADVGASQTLTGPTSGFAKVVSVTYNTTTYAAGAQIKSTGGAYALSVLNSVQFHGCTFVSGANISFTPLTTVNNSVYRQGYHNCTFKFANGGVIQGSQGYFSPVECYNCTFDYSADTSNGTNGYFVARCHFNIFGGSVVKGDTYNRTGSVITGSSVFGRYLISGLDLSVIGSTNDLVGGGAGYGTVTYYGCKLPATWSLKSADLTGQQEIKVINCGESDDPRIYYHANALGLLTYQTSIYRTSGASVETGVVSWKVETLATCNEADPFITDWIYSTAGSSGSKTFTLYVANNTEDLHDDDIWLEVQYMGTVDVSKLTLGSDQRTAGAANASASTTAQTDDTASTWNGATLTYMQSLAVAVTLGETGLYRARVCVGKPSLTVYIDPLVTVT